MGISRAFQATLARHDTIIETWHFLYQLPSPHYLPSSALFDGLQSHMVMDSLLTAITFPLAARIHFQRLQMTSFHQFYSHRQWERQAKPLFKFETLIGTSCHTISSTLACYHYLCLTMSTWRSRDLLNKRRPRHPVSFLTHISPLSFNCHNSMSEYNLEACALDAAGALKLALDITWYNDADDDVPMATTSVASTVRPL